MLDLRDKRILVTGSTRGIGLAVAQRLAALGAVVGIHGRAIDKATSVASSIPRSIPLSADLATPENGAILVRQFAEKAGGIDGLVNNAGAGRAQPFRAMKEQGWDATFRLNLTAAMLASREAYIMMRQSGGTIVNIASISAHGPGKWMGADYAASKAALVSLTQSLAFESARFNVRVNAVSPGFVETDMTSVLPDSTRQNLGIPMGRFARPDEIAWPVAWLLSAESDYVTGVTIHVDGGAWMGA